jgi:lysophospholipase L1-like esterase
MGKGRIVKARLAAIALGFAFVFAWAGGAGAQVGYPNSMAATGDSITRAFNTGLVPYTDAPWNSWSTGALRPWTHYRRILAANPQIFGRNYNNARSGARMADLERQAGVTVAQGAEYVTILMGANDACASSEAAMTPVAEFRGQFERAMTTLTIGLPTARILVVSIPDVYRLWLILHNNPRAVLTWRLTGFCRSMLARPTSTAPADEARRQRVRQRVVDYNTQLEQVCVLYVQCRFDGNAVFEYPFGPEHVSTRDYFHPSLAGQRTLADVTWAAGYQFSAG